MRAAPVVHRGSVDPVDYQGLGPDSYKVMDHGPGICQDTRAVYLNAVHTGESNEDHQSPTILRHYF
jgi:hypothetical protein